MTPGELDSLRGEVEEIRRQLTEVSALRAQAALDPSQGANIRALLETISNPATSAEVKNLANRQLLELLGGKATPGEIASMEAPAEEGDGVEGGSNEHVEDNPEGQMAADAAPYGLAGNKAMTGGSGTWTQDPESSGPPPWSLDGRETRLASGNLGEPATGVGAVEGAFFGLLGLILAFTFSGAAARYDWRRDMVTEEANDIGTAWLRVDLVPEAQQPALRQAFREYLDHRITAYQMMPDTTAMLREIARSEVIQGEIWRQAVEATSDPSLSSSRMLLLPALNAMIDITTTRTMAARSHMPEFIYLLLFVLAMVGGLVGGYAMSVSPKRSLVQSIGFAVILVGDHLHDGIEIFPVQGLDQAASKEISMRWMLLTRSTS